MILYFFECSYHSDLLLVDPDIVLELPSFKKSECKVNSKGMREVQTGMDQDRLVACNGTACFSLQDGSWMSENSMIEGRTSAGSSNSPNGWLVSGGIGADNDTLFSTEYYSNGVWTSGPRLPPDSLLRMPCQLQIGSKIIITGDY